MHKENEHWNLVLGSISDFFSDPGLGERIKCLERIDQKTGIEKWLQMEFAMHLIRSKQYETIGLEKPIFGKQVDLLLPARSSTNDGPIAIELKVSKTPQKCIELMVKDADRAGKIAINGRRSIELLFCVGLHNQIMKKEFHGLVERVRPEKVSKLRYIYALTGRVRGCSRNWSVLIYQSDAYVRA
jgi:hypothetical protein